MSKIRNFIGIFAELALLAGFCGIFACIGIGVWLGWDIAAKALFTDALFIAIAVVMAIWASPDVRRKAPDGFQ